MSSELPINASLQNGKYQIKDYLGQGGFGITYLADFIKLHKKVAVKELFIAGNCVRIRNKNVEIQNLSGTAFDKLKENFIKEAQTLAKFEKIAGIVRVTDIFEENNTAYLVMDYVEGESLRDKIRNRHIIPEKEALNYTQQVLNILSQIHKEGILHRDIKPDNMLLDNSGNIILIDFGIAREFEAYQTMTHTSFLTPHYAPFEQYSQQAQRGAFTDIYSLGATLYHCITGKPPVSAPDRMIGLLLPAPQKINNQISNELNNAILKAMELKPEDRFQSCEEFGKAIKGGKKAPETANKGDVNAHDDFWKEVKNKNTLETYQAYLLKYPLGKYAKEAERRIKDLIPKGDTNAIIKCPNCNASYRLPKDKHIKFQCNECDTEIELENGKIIKLSSSEEVIWQKAQEKDDIRLYEKLLQQFPNGKFAYYAQQRINEINKRRRVDIDKNNEEIKVHNVSENIINEPSNSVQKSILVIFIGFLAFSFLVWKLSDSKVSPMNKKESNLVAQNKNFIWQDLEGFKVNNKYGFRHKETQKTIISPIYDYVYEYSLVLPFNEGLARVNNNGKWFYINKEGKCVKDCPKTSSENKKTSNLVAKNTGAIWQDLKSFKVDNKYGFRHKDTKKVIISPLYDYVYEYSLVLPFNEGLARVNNNGKWFYINKEGKCVKDCP